jgi:hypothetical protein
MKTFPFVGLAACLLTTHFSFAQDNAYPALAQLFSQTGPKGSARMQGLGGGHAALGADVTTLSSNPAGLGFYTRSELNITPSFQLSSNASSYLDRTTNGSKSNANLGNIGLVIAGDGRSPYSGWRNGAFAISYSRELNLNTRVAFGGRNNVSSMVDSFAEAANNEVDDFNTSVGDFNGDLFRNGSNFEFPTSMYYFGRLIEPAANSKYFLGTEGSSVVDQNFTFESTGSTTQWNFAYGASYRDKLYLGIAMATPRFSYETRKIMNEQFVTGREVQGYTFDNNLETQGRGLNFSFGAIYRPNETIRLGASLTTPTWYDVTETTSQGLRVDLVKPLTLPNGNTQADLDLINALSRAGYSITTQNGQRVATSIPRLTVSPFDVQYRLTTPLKANGGLAIFFDKKGFISADVEYIGYRGMKLRSDDLNAGGDFSNGEYTNDVKRQFQNVVNLKVGGEFRNGPVYVRGGVGYYPDAFKNNFDDFDRTRVVLSGGLGYRSNAFSLDFGAWYSTMKRPYSPYTLPDSRDYASAIITNNTLNVSASVGVFF